MQPASALAPFLAAAKVSFQMRLIRRLNWLAHNRVEIAAIQETKTESLLTRLTAAAEHMVNIALLGQKKFI